MKRKSKNALIAGLEIFIIPLVIALVFLILSALFTSCRTSTEPGILNISARYQNAEYGMILLIEHNYKQIDATLEWQGYVFNMQGKFDEKNKQIIMGGDGISMNLIYNISLAGGMTYNNWHWDIRFDFVNKLYKHNQSGVT